VTDLQRPGDAGALALEVVLRSREGHSQTRIATALGISRKRVRTILERYQKGREQGMNTLDELAGSKRKKAKSRGDPRPCLLEQHQPHFDPAVPSTRACLPKAAC